jgi:tRNA pseudouridine38-40 synthase
MPGGNVRFRLAIAYDGGAYAGWQAQATGLAVQEVVEKALRQLFPNAARLNSSSRTDAGVHALGMVAHVDIPANELRVPAKKLALALNAFLPEDIRVVTAARCRPDFHARFDATGKQYRYFVWNHPAMNPLLRRSAWHVPKKLDLAAMRRAAVAFVGRRDFKSFAGARNYEMETTVRAVTRCDIKRSGPLLTFIIEGEGFLYKMCRGMTGTLVQIGLGRFPADSIGAMLEGRDRRVAGMTAPARGLVLWRVDYGKKKK